MPIPKGKAGMEENMREFKAGALHSGKGGPIVNSRKQAVAIGMSRTGMSKRKASRGQGRSR